MKNREMFTAALAVLGGVAMCGNVSAQDTQKQQLLQQHLAARFHRPPYTPRTPTGFPSAT